jgi:hypothetical protein
MTINRIISYIQAVRKEGARWSLCIGAVLLVAAFLQS